MKRPMLKIALIGTGIAVSMASALANIATAPAPAPKAAVAKAEAGNVLTLADGTTAMTWDEFAKALNNPQTVEGKIEDLPSDNASLLAYNKAMADTATVNQALRDAEADSVAVQTARGKVTAAATTLSAAEQDSIDKKTALGNASDPENNDTTALAQTLADKKAALATAEKNLQNFIDSLEKCYNDSVAWRNKLRDDSLAHVNQRITSVGNQIDAVEKSIALYQDSVKQVNDTISEKYTKNVSTSVNPTWLATIVKNAQGFQKNYSDKVNDYTMYYKEVSVPAEEDWEEPLLELYVSFVEPTGETGWSGPITQQGLRSYFSELNGRNPKVSQFDNVYVYFGAEYEKKAGSNTKLSGSNIKLAGILTAVVGTVETVTGDSRFQTTTSFNVNPTDDRFFDEDTTEAEKTKVRNEYNDWLTKRTNYNSKITTLRGTESTLEQTKANYNTQADNIQDHITSLGTVIDNAKTKWEAAKSGTLTGDARFDGLNTAITDAQKDVTDAQSALNDAKGNIATAQKNYDDALVAYRNALAAKAKADADLLSAENVYKAAVAAAQKTADDAAALVVSTKAAAQKAADEIATQNYQNNFKTITLTADVTVTTTINDAFAGKIDAKGHIFNCNVPAFEEFTGTLRNAAINGTFRNNTVNAAFVDVAVWTGAGQTPGRFYDDEGQRTNYSTIGDLGYAARDYYGVNFVSKKLVAIAPETKVYSITVYSIDGSTPYFAHLVDNKFVNESLANGMGILANTFVSSASASVDDETNGMANLLVNQNGTWRCDNVVIKDVDGENKANVNFYAPFQISATKVTYNREFAKGYNAVCLPFALKPDANQGLQYVLKYDTEDNDKFWFTAVASGVAAYEPALVYTPDGGSSITFNTTNIVATNDTQMYVGGTDKEGKFTSHGTVKYILAGEFLGESKVDNVYGLVGNVFKKAGSGAHFSAFRMGIRSDNTSSPTMADAPRRIGVRDENGFEITDLMSGVESVAAEETSLSVATGVGEIVFTSEADYGKVEVYSIDGRIVAVADVMAGTSSVNVAKGVYIVMGKKVMVK